MMRRRCAWNLQGKPRPLYTHTHTHTQTHTHRDTNTFTLTNTESTKRGHREEEAATAWTPTDAAF